MNIPPAEYTLVKPDPLRDFITQAFVQVEMPTEQAAFLADLLVTNDLRGVFSHGTVQALRYVTLFKNHELTPTPTISTISETPTTLVLDGGGGLGYFPCYQATNTIIEKAQKCGIAVATTRNHGHFGAAGIYARLPLAHGLFCYVTSGHQLNLHPGDFVMSAAGGSPMAFGLPTREEPPFVLDFGAIHDMYLGHDAMKPIVEMVPSTVLRSFGLGCACQALGGLLCGVPLDADKAVRQWSGANQGSFIIVVDIKALYPIEQFTQEMDEYARRVRQCRPFPGIAQALMPGAIEWEREQKALQEGIRIAPPHAGSLQQLAAMLALPNPLERQ